jgi:DNA end-binding protein Ku
MVEADELDAIAPGRSRSLDIHTFVDLDEIDPIFYQKTYYLAPGSDETTKTYALLRDAMAGTNRAAIATLVMRGKEYLAAIRPDGDLLVLETMFFADEVRDAHEEIDRLPGRIKLRPQELKMAEQLIGSMSGDWTPADFRDTYTDRVHELINAKTAGVEVSVADLAPDATTVVDLMDVLRRSVDAAKKRRSRPGSRASARSAPAKPRKTPAKPKKAQAKPKKKATARDLPAMTKPDLVALAGKLDVPGRSRMTRVQLETAIKAAQPVSRRAS